MVVITNGNGGDSDDNGGGSGGDGGDGNCGNSDCSSGEVAVQQSTAHLVAHFVACETVLGTSTSQGNMIENHAYYQRCYEGEKRLAMQVVQAKLST